MVGIEVSCSATELSCHRTSLQHLQLFVETVDEHHHLLAKTGWRGWLAVGLCKHRHIFPLFSILLEKVDELLELRDISIMECILYRERHRSVVDIL